MVGDLLLLSNNDLKYRYWPNPAFDFIAVVGQEAPNST